MNTINEDQVYEQLQNIVGTQMSLKPSEIERSSRFTTDLGADSLDVVELVMTFEEEFDIPIGDEVAGDMSTVQDAVEYITKTINDEKKTE